MRTVTVTVSDGLALAVHEHGGDAGDCPVILMHGFSSNAAMNWQAPGIVAALTKGGRRVYAPDARGHGASQSPHDGARYSRDRMARDTIEIADALGLTQYDLAGYSMGAMNGVIVAGRDSRVRRFAVCGCVQQILSAGAERARNFGAVPQALRAPSREAVSDPWARTFRAVAERMGGDLHALAACFEGIESDPQASLAALAGIVAPTLIVGGRADPLMKDADALAARIAIARVAWVEGDHIGAVSDPAFPAALAGFFG